MAESSPADTKDIDGLDRLDHDHVDWDRIGEGIVHLGLGAFHRAHQAVYTHEAIAAAGGNWRIVAASLRSSDSVDAINAQHGEYSLIVRDASGPVLQRVRSIGRAIAAAREPEALLAVMCDPAIRIVTLTVTEKAYGLTRPDGALDVTHPAVSADLVAPHTPRGVLGLLVETLARRQAAGVAPYTVLCCDNLPENGRLLRHAVIDFARASSRPALADWIAAEVAFPCSMVDRITPAPTDTTRADAERLGGRTDPAAIEAEPFRQWVIEDCFTGGRPAWERAGALFVDDVAPYETMKLRMLNGSHSFIAYAGVLCGLEYVRDVMTDAPLRACVRRHLAAAADTLSPLPGIDTTDYAEALMARYDNPAIAHRTAQIAMDGTEKLPQRLLAPAEIALARGTDLAPFAVAVACWMRYCLETTDDGTHYALDDPRAAMIRDAVAAATGWTTTTPRDHATIAAIDPVALAEALQALPGVFPPALLTSGAWQSSLRATLGRLLRLGVHQALADSSA